jgi:hypothetical protein
MHGFQRTLRRSQLTQNRATDMLNTGAGQLEERSLYRFHISSPRVATMALLAAVLVGAGFPAYTAAATYPISFNVTMGDFCLHGLADGGATVHVEWRAADSSPKAIKNVVASLNGNWGFCKPGAIVTTGDTIDASDGNSSHGLVVPPLTLFQNRDTNVYKGSGPPGDYVKLICGLSNGFEPCQLTWKLKVNSEGRWSYKPGWDVNGDENMGLSWKNANGDKVRIWNTSPFVTVTIGQAAFHGAARAASPATVVLKKPNFDVRGTAHPTGAIGYGTFTSRFRDTNGDKVKVHVGDLVTSDMASDLDFVVSNITASANVSTGHVTGNCVPDSLWFITVFRNGVDIDGDDWRFDPDTHFNADFSSLPLMAGDRVLVSCQLPTRDRIQKWFTAA